MKRYYYDLHIHSCLSPCADNDNTPQNIAGMASLSGYNILALTDHNTAKNCPAFFKACEAYGIVPVAGMEVTSSEDIHIVCLFEKLDDALAFDSFVSKKRFLIKNRPDIFGDQLIIDEFENVTGIDEHLLPNATSVSIEDINAIVGDFGGIAYPAHIDRPANGVIAILGTFPDNVGFSSFELRFKNNEEKYRSDFKLFDKKLIVSSDAHTLSDIDDAENYFELDAFDESPDSIRRALFEYLRTNDSQ